MLVQSKQVEARKPITNDRFSGGAFDSNNLILGQPADVLPDGIGVNLARLGDLFDGRSTGILLVDIVFDSYCRLNRLVQTDEGICRYSLVEDLDSQSCFQYFVLDLCHNCLAQSLLILILLRDYGDRYSNYDVYGD
jgi:hypothetical protein